MALKKDFSTGSKFYYGVIEKITWQKTADAYIEMDLQVRDSEDADYLQVENSLSFTIKNDENYPFSISALSQADSNIIKLSYDWIKTNIELFADFTDA